MRIRLSGLMRITIFSLRNLCVLCGSAVNLYRRAAEDAEVTQRRSYGILRP